MAKNIVSFDVAPALRVRAKEIATRAVELSLKHGVRRDVRDIQMDIIATHANGCPLDLDRLAAADDFNFAHDVFGIERHIDRATGKLTRCFLPRFALREVANG